MKNNILILVGLGALVFCLFSCKQRAVPKLSEEDKRALEEQIEKTSNYEGLLNNVLHQIKVERYKDLNKDKNIEVY